MRWVEDILDGVIADMEKGEVKRVEDILDGVIADMEKGEVNQWEVVLQKANSGGH